MQRAVAVAALLMAGCAAVPTSPHVPEGPGQPWEAWAGPWAAMSAGCGLCGGVAATAPEFFLVAIDRGGRVLRVDYALGSEVGVAYAQPGLLPWAPIVEPLFADGRQYGQNGQPGHVRVFAVHALALAPRDAAAVEAVITAALRDAGPMGPPDLSDCADCGAPVLTGNGLRVQLGLGEPEERGWGLLRLQMQALAEWMAR